MGTEFQPYLSVDATGDFATRSVVLSASPNVLKYDGTTTITTSAVSYTHLRAHET